MVLRHADESVAAGCVRAINCRAYRLPNSRNTTAIKWTYSALCISVAVQLDPGLIGPDLLHPFDVRLAACGIFLHVLPAIFAAQPPATALAAIAVSAVDRQTVMHNYVARGHAGRHLAGDGVRPVADDPQRKTKCA